MKNLNKILIATVFFSLSVAFCAYAEEMKTAQTVNTTTAETPKPFTPPTAVAVATPVAEAVTPAAPAVPPVPVEKTTLDNLQDAFNGESNLHARYLVFAKKADEEGYGKVARLFRAAARTRQIHFERYAKLIKELRSTPVTNIETPVVKSTAENLKTAMDGEIHESTVIYPEFLAKAKKDQNKGAIDAFEDAGKAEAAHAGLYKKALENLKAWKIGGKNFYVCPLCGNIMENMKSRSCPICKTQRKEFIAVK